MFCLLYYFLVIQYSCHYNFLLCLICSCTILQRNMKEVLIIELIFTEGADKSCKVGFVFSSFSLVLINIISLISGHIYYERSISL